MSSSQIRGGTAHIGMLSTGFLGTLLAAAILSAAPGTVQAGGKSVFVVLTEITPPLP